MWKGPLVPRSWKIVLKAAICRHKMWFSGGFKRRRSKVKNSLPMALLQVIMKSLSHQMSEMLQKSEWKGLFGRKVLAKGCCWKFFPSWEIESAKWVKGLWMPVKCSPSVMSSACYESPKSKLHKGCLSFRFFSCFMKRNTAHKQTFLLLLRKRVRKIGNHVR